MKERIILSWLSLFLSLSKQVDSQVTYSGSHSMQVARLARATARQMSLDEAEVSSIYWASLLHDIGKVGVPVEILSKKGPLDEMEWQIMRLHPIIGANIIRSCKPIATASPIILYHQEKYDGSGYPYGLRGESIPISSRILAVADAYDAMTNRRVYREALPPKQALVELWKHRYTQFDPFVV
ncbi:MAG: HD-GYP domain-containing protein, partial [Anaerolineales bacterium]|nr:HD-GYP domain-containing protein [Anaerolineales bacterium]MDW8446441.1 HD-GYP domain-containing protein [Anaerolineales bacterium]